MPVTEAIALGVGVGVVLSRFYNARNSLKDVKQLFDKRVPQTIRIEIKQLIGDEPVEGGTAARVDGRIHKLYTDYQDVMDNATGKDKHRYKPFDVLSMEMIDDAPNEHALDGKTKLDEKTATWLRDIKIPETFDAALAEEGWDYDLLLDLDPADIDFQLRNCKMGAGHIRKLQKAIMAASMPEAVEREAVEREVLQSIAKDVSEARSKECLDEIRIPQTAHNSNQPLADYIKRELRSRKSEFDEMKCSICLDTMIEPVVTVCQHRFCQCCLANLWSRSGSSQRPRCPDCRAAVSFPNDVSTSDRGRSQRLLGEENYTQKRTRNRVIFEGFQSAQSAREYDNVLTRIKQLVTCANNSSVDLRSSVPTQVYGSLLHQLRVEMYGWTRTTNTRYMVQTNRLAE
jgi:hypothetical protein